MDTIKYTRRVNLGNEEHEELEVISGVAEGQERVEAMKKLRNSVHEALGLVQTSTSTKVEAPKKEIEQKGETKVTKEKPQGQKVDEPKKEEVKKEEPKKEEPKSETAKEEVKEEPKKEEPKKEAAKETKVKIKPSKATAYDRDLDTHKALLGQFLDKEFSTWRSKEVLPKASKASRALNGTEFQDGEGNILESFKEAFRPYMK